MKVAELLERRRGNWVELERLCDEVQAGRRPSAETVTRFANLYRAVCADLALADSNQLPPNTVRYLHRLVGRAHNCLYRTSKFQFDRWMRLLLVDVPQQIFQDRCVQVMFLLFWGTFVLSAVLAATPDRWPNYCETVMGAAMIEQLESSFAKPLDGLSIEMNMQRSAFYIQHNTSIGLICFATGILIIPGIMETIWEAAVLGASFGYMAQPGQSAGDNFYEFVTAHAPFELTAIVLAAGAGLRLGMGGVRTDGLSRVDALCKTGWETMPVMGASMALFFLAALTEAFVSPFPLPMIVKGAIATFCSGLLMFYFVVLGFPRRK